MKKVCTTAIRKPSNFTKQLIGRIYLSTNTTNGKVYVGKVEFPRTIRERWEEHHTEARKLKRLRDQNPKRKIWGSHLNNALLKYAKHFWKLKEIDTAFNKEELNKKEKLWIKRYDSMNPNKGYNMREGGEGGRVREEVKEKISIVLKRKYREDPIYREKMRNLSKDRMRDPEYKAQHLKWLNEGLKKKRQDKEFIRKFSEIMTLENRRRVKDPKYIQKQKKSHEFQKIRIPDVKQLLTDIKNGIESRDLVREYKMSRPTLNRRICEILGKFNVRNYKEAQKFLKDIEIDALLKKL